MLPINTVLEQISKKFPNIIETLNSDFLKFKEEIETVYNDLKTFHNYHYEKFKICEEDYTEKIKKQQDSEVTIDKLAEKTLKDILQWHDAFPLNLPRPIDINDKLESLKNKRHLVPIKNELLDEFIKASDDYLAIPIFLIKVVTQNRTESETKEILNSFYVNKKRTLRIKHNIYPSMMALENIKSELSINFNNLDKKYRGLKNTISNNFLNYIVSRSLKSPAIALILLVFLGFSAIKIYAYITEPKLPDGTYNYGGSTTWRAIHDKIDETIQKKFPKVHLNYDEHMSEMGSNSGINRIIKGDSNLAFVEISRVPTPEEKRQLRENGLIPIPIAEDGIAIAVNPKLQISGLTMSQIKNIYTDKITNWNQISDRLPNLPIHAYSRDPKASGTAFFFKDRVLENENFGNNVKIKTTTTYALKAVISDPEGIYYASASEIVHQCGVKVLSIIQEKPISLYKETPVFGTQCTSNSNHVDTELLKTTKYPLHRTIYIIIKKYGKNYEFGRDFINWLRGKEGKELIEEAGFAPLESNPLPKEIK